MTFNAYRWLGFLSADKREIRFTWLCISKSCGLSVGLYNFGDDDDLGHFSLGFTLIFFSVFLQLRFLPRRKPVDQILDKWGVSLDGDSFSSVHLNWGHHCKIVHLPWALTFFRKSVLARDGTWLHELAPSRQDDLRNWKEFRESVEINGYRERHPYTYTLRNGTVQERIATVSVEEWEFRRRWLLWTPWLAQVRRSIEVNFSDEVGERSGSWKGGTIGCGYEMKSGETLLDTLRRMECERVFQ